MPTVMFRFVTCASDRGASGPGSSHFARAQQPLLPGNSIRNSGFKTSENFKRGFAETGSFALGVLMWGCRWRGLALQWASSNICLASEEESPLPLLHLSPPKAFRRHGSHQAAYARPDVPSQGTHSLQSTVGALNKWLLRTKFEFCRLLCDCSTKGKTRESHRHSCSFPAKSLKRLHFEVRSRNQKPVLESNKCIISSQPQMLQLIPALLDFRGLSAGLRVRSDLSRTLWSGT